MDAFTQSAQTGRMRDTLVIGATFGIFLTFGNAWSAFLEQLAYVIMPEQTDDTQGSQATRLLLYASLTSVLCLLLMLGLMNCNRAADRATAAINRKNVRRIARRLPGVHIVHRPVEDASDAPPSALMGNTNQSQSRRMSTLSRDRVRQRLA